MKGKAGSTSIMTSGTALPHNSCVDGQGKGISPPPMLPHDRWVMGISLPCSQLQDWLTHIFTNRSPQPFLHDLLNIYLSLWAAQLSSPTRCSSRKLVTFSFWNTGWGAGHRLGVNGWRKLLIRSGTFFSLSWSIPGNFAGLAPGNWPSGIPKTVSPSKMTYLDLKIQRTPRGV